MTEIESALLHVASASGGLFFLVGEPGIGKTRLARDASERARAQGIRTSWGRCWEAGGAPAFWPWREALEGLGILFPDPKTITAGDPAAARFALFREVANVLGREANQKPMLIVLEDLHAADPSTLLLLEFVTSLLRTLPIVVIGTYRDLEASLRPDCADALARTGRSGRVLELGRLREAEVAALVHDAIDDGDDRLAKSVYETTQGNPLFVQEMVQSVRARGTGTTQIPLGVREIIRQRLSLVSKDARRVLEAGAVLGVEFEAEQVSRMVEGALGVLDDATRSGLVTAERGRFRFSHALYREALYHDLPRAARLALHREAARALAATGAPLAETAHQLLESGPDVAADAIDHAVRAAALAVDVYAFEDAIALLDRARAAIPPGPLESRLRCRVMIALGEARIRSGDAAGRTLCVEAAQIARELGDTTLLALAGLAYGAVFVMGGVDPILVGLLVEALENQKVDSPLSARAMARLAAARQPSPPAERDRDIRLALEAVAMARRVAEPRELLDVLHSASGALYGAAHPSLRLSISREQERLAEELGDTTRLLNALVRRATDHMELADFAAYADLATKYEALAARVGAAAQPWRVPLMRSMHALATDDFVESERQQAESRRIECAEPRARRAQTFHRICYLRATERHAELRASIPGLRSFWMQMPYGVVLAEPRVASILARIGAEEELRALLETLPDQAYDEQINAMSLAEAVWLSGDPALAKRVQPAVELFGERWTLYWLDTEIVEAPCSRGRAYLAGILGDWEECDRLFARAIREVEAVGKQSMAARMRFELGDLLVRQSREPERARQLLADARALASALGLSELVELIERRHGTTAPPAARASSGFAMMLEGEYFAISTPRGPRRFKASRGMHYLARLVERPGVDVHVLDLAGSADGADRGDAGELLDGQAFREYRARLEALRDKAADAEALGNVERAQALRGEMEAVASELAKATGRGGRSRRGESAVDRARSAVQRRIKDALDRIAGEDEELGQWLKRSISTGNYCRFTPHG